ncbi:Ig-like domain-containing protein [Polaromonas sp.]|uniref:RHS repeat-associated core domain-containing protein n=1 Tax=Polaromonas sp. TaxID=1869339 RepID=UPI0032648899
MSRTLRAAFAAVIFLSSFAAVAVAPTVSITSPVNGATFGAPASITINANAADSDGRVRRVDFYSGTTLVGSDTTAPYTLTRNNLPVGSYTFVARATDNSGAVTSSSPVHITVAPNTPPTVSITSPANGAAFPAGATISGAASAADSDGRITKVEVYIGSTLLGSDSTAPYTFTRTNVPAGSYSITVRAYDNSGAVTTSSPVVITVGGANTPPTVAVTSPANGSSFVAPAAITINANAADSNGTVSKVDFYNGATLLGTDTTAPYSFAWANVAAGSYNITARATDNNGAVTNSAVVGVTVTPAANTPPTVAITSPTNGSSFVAPAAITINANAVDSNGTVSKVDFYNGATLLGTDTSAPYSFAWANVAAGSYNITARATDNNGAVTTSGVIGITVAAANVSPTVSITSPANGASFVAPASIAINANAADSDGTVSKVDFYNGATLLGTSTAAPYSFVWPDVSAGSYSITARATDNNGAVTTSGVIGITVAAANVPPTVSLTSPANGSSFTAPAGITLNANATDSDGTVSKVDFYNGATLLGTSTAAPYSFAWTNVPVGSYDITAQVTDNSGAVTTSAIASITVLPATFPPAVSITSPTNGAAFVAPATITINANATDSDGTVSMVEFFNGATLLGTSTAAPYSFVWSNVPLGSYSLTARATDNSGSTTTSAAVIAIVGTGETITYLHNDFSGNPIAATDTSGALVWKENFRPYGDRLNNQSEAASNRQWFHGKAVDTETGLSYFGARYYDASLGRFMGVDPVGYQEHNVQSFNRYAYGNNNPYKYADPDGKNPRLLWYVGEGSFYVATRLGLGMVGSMIGLGLYDILHQESADAPPAEGKKRGPKTNGEGPHNEKIVEEADRLVAEGNRIVAGGGREKEQLVPTPGGAKEGRRPDIIIETPEGERRGRNIGRTKADGTPVPREVEALNDLNGPGKLPTDFVPYKN